MRLIDVDDPKLYEKVYCPQDWSGIEEYSLMIEWRDLLDALSVDAVKVVRCKDCKHWIIDDYWNGNPDQARRCRFAGWMCGANGYCLYGERKTNVEVQNGQ